VPALDKLGSRRTSGEVAEDCNHVLGWWKLMASAVLNRLQSRQRINPCFRGGRQGSRCGTASKLKHRRLQHICHLHRSNCATYMSLTCSFFGSYFASSHYMRLLRVAAAGSRYTASERRTGLQVIRLGSNDGVCFRDFASLLWCGRKKVCFDEEKSKSEDEKHAQWLVATTSLSSCSSNGLMLELIETFDLIVNGLSTACQRLCSPDGNGCRPERGKLHSWDGN
jgi:hypothetical protein